MLVDHEDFPEVEVSDRHSDNGQQKELDLMHECIQELPSSFKSVIILRDIEGLSYEDIAQIEELPVGTVRSRLNRGRSLLQEMFFKRRGI